ncbi:MAG: thiamine-phosphate kinase [Phycisphaerales bacterium]
MDESRLLAQIITSGTVGEGVIVGPGDDCAVIEHGGVQTLLTVDQVIESRHFIGPLIASDGPRGTPGTPFHAVAHKAIARSISDIAAMGGRPRWALATAALPAGLSDSLAGALFEAMRRLALTFGAPLVGGDIAATSGPLVLTVTVGGAPHPARGPVLRSGARPGDVSLSQAASVVPSPQAAISPSPREWRKVPGSPGPSAPRLPP